jgi:protein ImuA
MFAPVPARVPPSPPQAAPAPAGPLVSSPANPPRDGGRRAALTALRARVRALERGTAATRGEVEVAPLGVTALDARLPGGGLPLRCLHEIEGGRAEWDDGVATGFCLALLARLHGAAPRAQGPVLWVSRWHDLYAPGLTAFGFDPGRLILVHADSGTDVLWAMEEALRCPRLAAVIGEVDALERGAGRRLQLAAEAGGVTAFALRRRLRPARRAEAPSAAVTRWRVMPAQVSAQVSAQAPAVSGRFLGRPCWQVELLRCRGAAPGQWCLEWDDATGGFALAAPLRDRPPAPAPGARRPEGGAVERRLAS